VLSLDQPRTSDLPELSAHLADGQAPAAGPAQVDAAASPTVAASGSSVMPVPEHFHELVLLAGLVDQRLPGSTNTTGDPRLTATEMTNEFQKQAEQARGQQASRS
jgi:hypothetical protein